MSEKFVERQKLESIFLYEKIIFVWMWIFQVKFLSWNVAFCSCLTPVVYFVCVKDLCVSMSLYKKVHLFVNMYAVVAQKVMSVSKSIRILKVFIQFKIIKRCLN